MPVRGRGRGHDGGGANRGAGQLRGRDQDGQGAWRAAAGAGPGRPGERGVAPSSRGAGSPQLSPALVPHAPTVASPPGPESVLARASPGSCPGLSPRLAAPVPHTVAASLLENPDLKLRPHRTPWVGAKLCPSGADRAERRDLRALGLSGSSLALMPVRKADCPEAPPRAALPGTLQLAGTTPGGPRGCHLHGQEARY